MWFKAELYWNGFGLRWRFAEIGTVEAGNLFKWVESMVEFCCQSSTNDLRQKKPTVLIVAYM